jgi:hypothetical protein
MPKGDLWFQTNTEMYPLGGPFSVPSRGFSKAKFANPFLVKFDIPTGAFQVGIFSWAWENTLKAPPFLLFCQS